MKHKIFHNQGVVGSGGKGGDLGTMPKMDVLELNTD